MTSRWRWWSLEKLDQGCPIEHLRRLTESLTTDSQQGLRHTPNGQPTLGPQQRPIREGTVSFYPVRIGNAIRQVELPGLQALNNEFKSTYNYPWNSTSLRIDKLINITSSFLLKYRFFFHRNKKHVFSPQIAIGTWIRSIAALKFYREI